MRTILMAAAAVMLLSGVAVTNEAKAEQPTGVNTVSGKKVVHAKHRYGSARRADGYSTLPPRRDYGRYSNLPGKDALNSKAFIQDH